MDGNTTCQIIPEAKKLLITSAAHLKSQQYLSLALDYLALCMLKKKNIFQIYCYLGKCIIKI